MPFDDGLIPGVKTLITGDHVLVSVMDVDENNIAFNKYIKGLVMEKYESFGYLVDVRDSFEKSSLVKSEFVNPKNGMIAKLVIPYVNVYDFVRKFEINKWTAKKSCKRRWSRLVFRKISKNADNTFKTIKYPDYVDTCQDYIEMPLGSRGKMDKWNALPMIKKGDLYEKHKELKNRDIVCGIVSENSFLVWCIVPHEFLLIWRTMHNDKNLSVFGKDVLKRISEYSKEADEAVLAEVVNDVNTVFKTSTKLLSESILWFQ
jgi:hypothetical protein